MTSVSYLLCLTQDSFFYLVYSSFIKQIYRLKLLCKVGNRGEKALYQINRICNVKTAVVYVRIAMRINR
jgi:hypothetical protein